MQAEDKIKQIIRKEGFITLERIMQEILTGIGAYYVTKHSTVGADGDFITAPEISQVFGEIIGLWCIEQWQKLGSPTEFNLVELGPGNGLLMRDLLRTARPIPRFQQALQLYMMEINPHLRINQQKNLSPVTVNYLSSLQEIPPLPSLIIANEFFDALPIRQYIKKSYSWHEAGFILKNGNLIQETIKLGLNKQAELKHRHPNAQTGAIVEESPPSLEMIQFIKEHLSRHGGAALIADYGYYINPNERNASQYNSTLQAVKNHKYHPLMQDLGQADWSAHVDFHALQQSSEGLKSKVTTQREFLINYGILLRAETLKSKIPAQEQAIIDRQIHRLISPDQMGELFKVLEVSG